jgi:hypothetical protein
VRQPAGDEAGELPAAGLVKVRDAVDTVQSVAAALTQPDVVLDGAERSAVAATSVAWRDDLPAWRSAVNGLAKQATGVGRGVQVLEGSAVNVLAARAELPVTVRNTLSQDVDAVVSLQPRSPRLVAGPAADVVVPARSSERVALPVRAVANGDTQVVVTVRAPDGALLGEPVTVPVRVRADWETRGILVIGAVLAAVLVAGLIRTIRQGGRRGAAAGADGVEVRERVR